MGGMVLETNISEIVTQIEAQNKMEKSESSPTMSIKVRHFRYYNSTFYIAVI